MSKKRSQMEWASFTGDMNEGHYYLGVGTGRLGSIPEQ